MNLPKYQLFSGHEFLGYEFVSKGSQGLIIKCIQLALVNREGVYSFAFGDKDPLADDIDDQAVSNSRGQREGMGNRCVGGFCLFRPASGLVDLCFGQHNGTDTTVSNGHPEFL